MTYIPALVSERYTDPYERGEDSCVYCSIAMLADAASGGPVTTPQALEAIDDPNRTKTGTTMPAGLAALAKAVPTAAAKLHYLSGENDVIDGLLAAGNGLAVTGLYGALPDHFRRWDPSYADGHAMYVQAAGPSGLKTKNVWLLDPLATDGYAGEWLPTESLHAFIASRTQHAYAPIAEGAAMGLITITHHIDTTYEVDVKAAVDLFDDPACTHRVTETGEAATLDMVGLPWPSAPSYAVVFGTGSPYPDKKTRAVIGYVRQKDASEPRLKPAPTPAPELHVFEATLTVTAPAAPKVVVTQGG